MPLRVALVATLAAACSPKSDDPIDTDTGTATDPGATTEPGGTASTEPGATMTTGTGGTETDTGESSSEPTTTDPTTGGATTGEDSVCPTYCAQREACGLPNGEDCVGECESELDAMAFVGAGCRDAYEGYYACFTEVTCTEQDMGACDDAYWATRAEVCARPACLDLCGFLVDCGSVSEDNKVGCAVECTLGTTSAFVDSEACALAMEDILICEVETLTCEQINEAASCEAEKTAQKEICGV
ncbi:hypothetical protein [Nannocystis bainbridge]|uniref:Uncharacterized protein n=1 Tax=Nannocystis bainbridge TaxID=2995303 RepID=A0ABT5E5K7_9BACT|nr:hypothetical protein [Nannocystis bainbridge]MDC0721131.1 hypothetical protein [Nannocystis bainbridge]